MFRPEVMQTAAFWRRIRVLMWPFRWLRIVTRGLLSALQLAPEVLLLAAVLVDEGPTGEARASSHFFPLVLWLFDDFAWTCARNSVIFALIVAVSSLFLGVAVRCALDRIWPRARTTFAAALLGVVAISPAFFALGQRGWFPGQASWPPRLGLIGATSPGVSLESWSGIVLWLSWIYSAVPAGTALVAILCGPSFRRVDPGWADAARLAGASSFRIARDFSWPIVRPAAVRAAGIVFLVAVVEPGAALVLGLRRTLAFQIVDAATGPTPFPRAAVWAIMSGVIGLGGHVLFRWRARASILGEAASANAASTEGLERRQRRVTSAVVSGVSAVGLILWGIVVWLPIVGLVWLLPRSEVPSSATDSVLANAILAGSAPFRPAVIVQTLENSVFFAVVFACAFLLVGWLGGGRSRASSPGGWRRWLRPVAALPPLVLGTGVLALPWLAALASRFLLDRGVDRAAAVGAELAGAVGVYKHPWVLMGCALGLALLRFFPHASGAHVRVRAVDVVDPPESCYAAAVHSGVARWRAWALGRPEFLSRLVGRFVMVWAIAATNVAPALLFATGGERRIFGPVFVALAGGDRIARSQAATLAVLGVVANLAAAGLAYGTGALADERDDMIA